MLHKIFLASLLFFFIFNKESSGSLRRKRTDYSPEGNNIRFKTGNLESVEINEKDWEDWIRDIPSSKESSEGINLRVRTNAPDEYEFNDRPSEGMNLRVRTNAPDEYEFNDRDWEEWISELPSSRGSSSGSSSHLRTNNEHVNGMSQQDWNDWINELHGYSSSPLGNDGTPTEFEGNNNINTPSRFQGNIDLENMFNVANNLIFEEANSLSPQSREYCKGKFIKRDMKAGTRSRCHGCYMKNIQIMKDWKTAHKMTKKRVDTYCSECNKAYCTDCFPTHVGPTQNLEYCKGNFIKKSKNIKNKTRCHGCYMKNYKETKDSRKAKLLTKTRVDTYCDKCDKPYCEDCFPTHRMPTNNENS